MEIKRRSRLAVLAFVMAYAAPGGTRLALGVEKADPCRDATGDPLLAVPACTKQIDRAPQDKKVPGLLNARGIAKFRLGDYDGALDDFNKALDRDPQDIAAYKNRGLTRQQLGDFDGAVASFNQALKLKKSADILNARGSALFSKGEYASAAADFTAALGLDSGFVKAYLNRGLANHFLRRLGDAKADLDTFIRLQPNNPLGYNDRAALLEDLDRIDDAIADYTTAIALAPAKWEGYSHRGEAWRLKGDLAKALADHDKALALSQNADAYNNRVLVWKDKAEYEKAIADCDQAILLDPKQSLSFANRGELERLTGASNQALVDLNKAVSLEPHSPIALTFRGDLFRAIGSNETAVADYKEALRYVPDFVAAYVGRGLAFEAEGSLAAARADFERALVLPSAIDARLAKPAQKLAAARLDSMARTDTDKRTADASAIRDEKARAQASAERTDAAIPHLGTDDLEEKAWQAAKASKDLGTFQAFVRGFPNSRYQSVAKDWIDLLLQAAASQQAAKEQAARDQVARDQAAQAAKDQAARDVAKREQATREQATREQAAKDQAARDQAARDVAVREQAAREQVAKEQVAKEQAARELAAKDLAAKDLAAKDLAAKEQAAKEQAARDVAAKEAAAREVAKQQAARDLAARELAARDLAARDLATKEQAARDVAAKEQAARDASAREQAARDAAAKAQVARDEAARDQAARDQAAKAQAARERVAGAAAMFKPEASKPANKVALVIGNAKYGPMALATPNNDANAIADSLERLDYKVIRRFDVSWAEFDNALARFQQDAAGASVALFYFSGHAMHFGTRSYLMPVGARLEGRHSVDFKMISLEDDVIQNALADVACKIVILDAARRNAVSDRFATEFGSHHDPADGAGLAPLPTADGLLIASSAPPETLAIDGQGKSTPYTRALIRELASPTGDFRAKFEAVRTDLQKDASRPQEPQYKIAPDWQSHNCVP